MGLPVTGFVYFLSVRMSGLTVRRDFDLFLSLPCILGYLFFLWKEVLFSAFRVMCRIWSREQPVSAVVKDSPEIRTSPCRILLADSITLTPGTITLEAEDGQFQVHCLEKDSSQKLFSGTMVRKIQYLEDSIL